MDPRKIDSVPTLATCLLALTVALASASALWSAAFPGLGVGPIPDGGFCPTPGVALDITFNVTGLTAPVGDVNVAVTVNHTWVGDLSATLIAPDGTDHVLFARTGVVQGGPCFGDSANLAGTYTFNDSAALINWWTEAAGLDTNGVLTPQAYLATQAGGPTQTQNPAPFTNIFLRFTGMPVSLANGTWTLRVEDVASSFAGEVTAASLGINQDCHGLEVSGGVTVATLGYATCWDLSVGDHVVRAPNGHLTLTSADTVALVAPFEVEDGARLTMANNPALDPLLLALEYSALLGVLDQLERAERAEASRKGEDEDRAQ